MARITVVLTTLTVVGLIVTAFYTPWNIYTDAAHHINRVISVVRPDTSRDFTPDQIAREVRLHKSLWPWQLLRLTLSVIVPLLAFVIIRSQNVISSLTPANLLWWFTGLVTLVLMRLSTVPVDWVIRNYLVEAGLSTQSMRGWLIDLAKSFALSTIVTLVLVALCVQASTLTTSRQLAIVPACAACLVILFSFLLPVVVEPLFNSFHSLPDGPLRTAILDESQRMNVPIADVLVADASRRTSALNAYVSGFGPTRRVVVYDTVLKDMPQDEIVVVASHELAHARYNDVLYATLISALFTAAGALALVSFLGSGKAVGREVAFIVGLATVCGLLAAPASNFVTRRVESRADVTALLNSSVANPYLSFIDMQKRIAMSNYSALEPNRFMFWFFSTHPTSPQRIAIARTVQSSKP